MKQTRTQTRGGRRTKEPEEAERAESCKAYRGREKSGAMAWQPSTVMQTMNGARVNTSATALRGRRTHGAAIHMTQGGRTCGSCRRRPPGGKEPSTVSGTTRFPTRRAPVTLVSSPRGATVLTRPCALRLQTQAPPETTSGPGRTFTSTSTIRDRDIEKYWEDHHRGEEVCLPASLFYGPER